MEQLEYKEHSEYTDKVDILGMLKSLGECNGVGPELFYPTIKSGEKAAKEICKSCIVVEDCLEYAIKNNEIYGIWGGTNERERRRMIKRQKTA